jgi:hypothetical protein
VPYRSCSSTNYKKILSNNIELAFRRLELEALEVGQNHADDSIINLFQNIYSNIYLFLL